MPQLRLGFTLPCRSLSSPLPGYGSVLVPTLRSFRVLHFKSFSPSSGISPPGGREERLGKGLQAQAPDCTHPRGLLPCPGEHQRWNIAASWGREKAVSLSSAYSEMHSGGGMGAEPSRAAEPPQGPGPAPPCSLPAPRCTGTSQGLTSPFWHVDSTHSSCRKLVPPAAPSCSTVQSPAQGRAT